MAGDDSEDGEAVAEGELVTASAFVDSEEIATEAIATDFVAVVDMHPAVGNSMFMVVPPPRRLVQRMRPRWSCTIP